MIDRLLFAMIWLLAGLAAGAIILWVCLLPICVHLRSSAVKLLPALRDLAGLCIAAIVFVLYAVSFALAGLAKFALARWQRFAFRLFGAVDCSVCKIRLHKPHLWLTRDPVPGSTVKIERVSHTYCRPCFEALTAQFRKQTISNPTARSAALHRAGELAASNRLKNPPGAVMRCKLLPRNCSPAPGNFETLKPSTLN